jgi:DNA polymerase-3 subunit epsilon
VIFDASWRYARRFKAAARAAPAGPLADFYAAGPVDLLRPTAPMAAIDLETDGLHAASDQILEIGYVGMTDWQVDLSTALRARIRPKSALRREVVAIHRITDDVWTCHVFVPLQVLV